MLDSGLPPAVRQLVPDYELLRRIGAGAYGEVWLARSNATGALRAAKIAWRSRFEDERPYQREFEGIQRFERISREHPSQLALFHIGRNDSEGYFYYVMELADPIPVGNDGKRSATPGERPAAGDTNSYNPHTLRADLANGHLPAARVLEIGRALSEALAHLHKNGLVHRDVKPSNVIFVNGRPKLADIGLVTDASDQCSIVGTEGYLPPEGPGTPQADIFALGKVLYEAATGMDRREYPKLPSDLRTWPDYREVTELNEVVLRACAREPLRRYPTCHEMHEELALLNRGKSVKQLRTRKQRLIIVRRTAFFAMLMTAIVVGALQFRQQRNFLRALSSNPQAEYFYRQALYERQSESLDRMKQAYTNLTEAVKLDPKFVDAYYQLFEVYFGPFGDKLPPHYNQLKNFRTIADKLHEISPNSAQYHTANSAVRFYGDWKFEEAIAEAALAIKIDPTFVRAHGVYAGYVLDARRDTDTALREFRVAERLKPDDLTIQSLMTSVFMVKRDFDAAVDQARKAVALEPRSALAHGALARACQAAGQYQEAIDEYLQFLLMTGAAPEQIKPWHDKLSAILHDRGQHGVWETLLEESQHDTNAGPYYYVASLHARLDHTNEALEFLNRACTNHDGSVVLLFEDDGWYPLRNDPRFQTIVRQIGFRPPVK